MSDRSARAGDKSKVRTLAELPLPRPDDFIEVKVAQVSVDPISSMPVVMLEGEGVSLAISIGLIEASAIASELEQIRLERPMTHDLMRTLLQTCEVGLSRVEIVDLRDDIYYATLWLTRDAAQGGPIEVDCRPSDALALALRMRAPVRVARKVVDQQRRRKLVLKGARARGSEPPELDLEHEPGPDESTLAAMRDGDELTRISPERFRELLESLSDEDFGKWKM